MVKKIISMLMLAIALTVLGASPVVAQEKGYGAVGAHMTGGFGQGYTNFGLGAKLQLNFLHPLRLEGAFASFVRNKNISMFDANFNAHWLAFLTDQICIYPLAGVGYHLTTLHKPNTKYGGLETDVNVQEISEWKINANLGGGLDYYLTDVIILNFEVQYKYLKHVKDASRVNVSVGIAYLF
jgi:outer membrane protein X